jgi:Protein of unknown function (DUF2652)
VTARAPEYASADVGEPTGSAPSLVRADTGSLVLTDISGYTEYLLGTELEHAQDVLSDLMGVVLESLQPPLTVSKLEGDAVFSYVLDGVCGASTLLDTIERSYFAFRSRQRDIAHATSCTCAACKQIPGLDLKFIVHHGSFVRRDLAGNEELTGRDVIVVHRLSKNTAADVAGSRGYVLLTDHSLQALQLDGSALGMLPHVERYEDVGEIGCHVEDLARRWRDENERQRVYVGPERASFERTFTAPVDRLTAWEWLTAPERRVLWQADAVTLVSPGGRQAQGVTNHCMHGPDVVVEHVSDWRPFDYVTKTYEFPGVGAMHWTLELADAQGSTTVALRGEALTGERLSAWEQMSGEVLAGVDHMIGAYVDALQAAAPSDGASTAVALDP